MNAGPKTVDRAKEGNSQSPGHKDVSANSTTGSVPRHAKRSDKRSDKTAAACKDRPYPDSITNRKPATLAMCEAVFGSLFSSSWCEWHNIPGAIISTQRERLSCLRALRDGKWHGLQDSAKFQRWKNCPPFAVPRDSRYACGYSRLCPFCWGRRVVRALYNDLDRLCIPPGTETCTKFWLFEFERREVYSREGTTPLLPQLLQRLKKKRRTELGSVAREGGFVLQNIVPSHGRICYLRRGLIITAKKNWQAAATDEDVRVHKGFSTKDLVDIVARVCRYPAALLRCPAAELREILDKTKGVHQQTRFGLLRNRG